MNDFIQEKVKRKKRQRSIALSDNMIEDIQQVTKNCISVSGFIRMAVLKELERCNKKQ